MGVFDANGVAVEEWGAVEVVEALGIWHGGGVEAAGAATFFGEVPFADEGGGVAGGFEDFGDGDFLRVGNGVQLFLLLGSAMRMG